MAIKAHRISHILARHLKAVLLRQPVVRHLHLTAVDDLLLEETIVVADAVAPQRQVLRRARVQEARSETAQTAVAKGRVLLVVVELFHLEAQLLQGLLVVVLDVKVRERVLHIAADEVLRRQVVAALRILLLEVRIGVVQRLDEAVPNGEGRGLVARLLSEVEARAPQVVLNVLHQGLLDALRGVRQVVLHHLAQLLVLSRLPIGRRAPRPLHLAAQQREGAFTHHLEALALGVIEDGRHRTALLSETWG
mmetsp:Transcript_18912/g.48505  ORF Transcript_18912/g.48505 Transcript_18912/m.48505 type:complete len:250 (+) Transcript_18912:2436-3185(+)